MLGTFFGLNTATLGLQANQALLDVTAQNIDNASTPGYSRQVAQLSPSLSLTVSSGGANPIVVGTGVQVQQITRIRDSFLDTQYQQQNSALGQATVMQSTMNQITAIVNDPSSTGLSTAMQNFWTAWSQLGSNPGDLSSAEALQQNAQTLTSTLNQMANQYTQLNTDLNTQLQTTTTQANSYIQQIAKLNQQINAIQFSGGSPNTLLDQRGQLLDKLSGLANISTSTDANGNFQLFVGGSLAVSGSTVAASLDASGAPTSATTIAVSDLTSGQLKGIEDSIGKVGAYSHDLDTFANQLATGSVNVQLAGAWEIPINSQGQFTVSGTLPDGTAFKAGDSISSFTTPPAGKPDDFVKVDNSISPNGMVTLPAGTTIDNVAGLNGLLQLGYSQNGQVDPNLTDPSAPASASQPNFFTPSVSSGQSTITAANISVGASAGQIAYALRPTLTTNASGAQSFSSSNPAMSGDGTLAITVNNLENAQMTFQSSNTAANMTGTLGAFWQGEISQLGIDAQTANNQVTNQTSLTQQIDQQRQSISGVNLDEEMANMIKYQQAYTASAKIVSAINGMLTSLMQEVQ